MQGGMLYQLLLRKCGLLVCYESHKNLPKSGHALPDPAGTVSNLFRFRKCQSVLIGFGLFSTKLVHLYTLTYI